MTDPCFCPPRTTKTRGGTTILQHYTANNAQILSVAVHHVSAAPSQCKEDVCICYVVRSMKQNKMLPLTLVRCRTMSISLPVIQRKRSRNENVHPVPIDDDVMSSDPKNRCSDCPDNDVDVCCESSRRSPWCPNSVRWCGGPGPEKCLSTDPTFSVVGVTTRQYSSLS